MENKYFAPKIEEFHVGFEFEQLSCNEKSWDKQTLSYVDAERFFIVVDIEKQTRVKYLDKEDVEGLGWVQTKKYSDQSEFQIQNGDSFWELTLLHDLGNIEFGINAEIEYYVSYEGTSDVLNIFSGEIKNKSELKRLMKQLHIDGSNKD